MTTPDLDILIAEALSTYNAKQAEENGRAKSWCAYEEEQDRIQDQMALELLPEPMRQHAHLENEVLWICIPGISPISRQLWIERPILEVVDSFDRTQVVSVIWRESKPFWVYRYILYEGVVVPDNYEETMDLHSALGIAASLGDTKLSAEQELEFKQRNILKLETKKTCPLLSNDNFLAACNGDKCTWWVTRLDMCALVVLASATPAGSSPAE